MFLMRYTIKAEWEQEDATVVVAELGMIEGEACQSAAHVGLKLADVKPLFTRLQEIVVREQLRHYCNQARSCSSCQRQRNVKGLPPASARYRTKEGDGTEMIAWSRNTAKKTITYSYDVTSSKA
jgi:hypothetical protein